MIENELNTNFYKHLFHDYNKTPVYEYAECSKVFLYDKNTNIEIIFDALNIDFYIHLCSIKMKHDSTQMKRMTWLLKSVVWVLCL